MTDMERQEIETRIKKVLRDNKFLALREMIDSITAETSLVSDLSLDSIQILELTVGIEKEFGFACGPDELNLDMFDRFASLVDFVAGKVSERVSAGAGNSGAPQ
jgi:acyl carrier protein